MLSGDTLAAMVALGRELAEAVMVDECTITGPSSGSTWDPATGRDVTTPGAAVYTGPCRVQAPQVQPGTGDAGGHVWDTRQLVVSVPVAAGDVAPGSVVTITAAALDPALVGRRYRVLSGLAKTAATARRLTCEEVIA